MNDLQGQNTVELHIILLLAGTFERLLVKKPEFQFCESFELFFQNLFSFQIETQPEKRDVNTNSWNTPLSEISTKHQVF